MVHMYLAMGSPWQVGEEPGREVYILMVTLWLCQHSELENGHL